MSKFSYNQKEVLLKTIRRYVKATRAQSLLDIGAGDGKLATRLAKLVPQHLAVEKNPGYVSRLKKAGVNVVKGTFPLKIAGQFDLVLISHSLPEKKGLYKNFLKEAWRKVKPGGILLMITFKGVRGGFAEIYRTIYGRTGSADQQMYDEMMTILKRFGKVKVSKIVSTIQTESLDALTDILLYPRATKEHRKRLEEILKRKFKAGKGYRFPTPHLVISVRK